jgi:peptidase E/N-acetylglutamate synthase-like GNAT family acetyltransferase
MKTIFAMGGGGFSMEPENPLLDEFILSLSEKEKPKVCFLATASGDAQGYIDRFYEGFKKHNCTPSHLSLFRPFTADIKGFLLKQDIIYVGGGNTRNLLTLWREWKLDNILKEVYENGTILSGISAGSICWFEQGVTDSSGVGLDKLECLGLLKGSNCPHYDGESERRPRYRELLSLGMKAGFAADDGVGLLFRNEKFVEAVSSHPEKKAFSVSKAEEKEITPRYLGGNSTFVRKAAISDAEGIHSAHMTSIQKICAKDYREDQINAWGRREFQQEKLEFCIKNDDVWVIESNGKIEGYGHLKTWKGKNYAEVMGLYLTPSVAGKGHGKTIINLIKERAKELGFEKLNLSSTKTSKSFYESAGFQQFGPDDSCLIGGVEIEGHPMEALL